MERFGRVLEARGDRAVVLMQRHSACENCGQCGGILGGPDVKDSEVEVKNPIGADQGELVRIQVEDQKVLLLSFVVYLIPAVVLVAGLLLGYQAAVSYGWAINPNYAGVISGVLLMLVTFGFIRKWDQKVRNDPRYLPVITSLVGEEEVNEA